MFIDKITDFRWWQPRPRHLERNDQINPNIELTDDEEYNGRVAIPAGAEDDGDVRYLNYVYETDGFSDAFSVWDYYDEGEDALTDISNGDYVNHMDDFDGEDDFDGVDDFDGEDDFDGDCDLESDHSGDRDIDEGSDDSLPAIELYVPYYRAHSSNISVNDFSNSSDSNDFVLPNRNVSHSLCNSTEDVSFTSSVPEPNRVPDSEFMEQESEVQAWSNELQKHWTEDECWDST